MVTRISFLNDEKLKIEYQANRRVEMAEGRLKEALSELDTVKSELSQKCLDK